MEFSLWTNYWFHGRHGHEKSCFWCLCFLLMKTVWFQSCNPIHELPFFFSFIIHHHGVHNLYASTSESSWLDICDELVKYTFQILNICGIHNSVYAPKRIFGGKFARSLFINVDHITFYWVVLRMNEANEGLRIMNLLVWMFLQQMLPENDMYVHMYDDWRTYFN